MMNFHSEAVRDKRARFYLPVRKILRNGGTVNPEILVGNREIQTTIHYLAPLMEMPPGSSLLLDFGAALHGGVRINGFSKPGPLEISFGESVSECLGEANQDCSRKRDTVTLPHCGMIEYGNTVFRFVRLKNPGVETYLIQNVLAVALERDLEVVGSFESSDELLNQIWKTAVRTVHLCMQDYLYDGAKRDRIVWMGDMHPEIRGILCAFADTSIIRDSLEFLIRQTPAGQPMNGTFYSYNCWFILGLWEYYLGTGDREFLSRHREYWQTMLEQFSAFVAADGRECLPPRRFLDWPNEAFPEAVHAGLQALLYWMLTAGEKLCCELNLEAGNLSAARKLLEKHIPDPVNRKMPAALLTLTGLADRRDVLERDPLNDISTFGGYYILQAKATRPALELIRRYWGGMLEMGATSFWEDFDLRWMENASRIDEPPSPDKADIHADFGNYCYKGLRHSLSHGWSCGPAPFLSERVLGIRFLEPGGKTIAVKPDLGDLDYVRGTFPTPQGVIRVEADRKGGVKVDLPPGITCVRQPVGITKDNFRAE